MIHGEKFIPLPPDHHRVILVANVEKIDLGVLDKLPGGPLSGRDVFIEFNKAVHHRELLALFAKRHIKPEVQLIVRAGMQRSWNAPADFEQFDFVYFLPRRNGLATLDFFREYQRKTGKHPTTGFAIWSILRKQTSRPVVLLGFDPIGDHTSQHCAAHAWEHEAAVYRQEKALCVK